MVGILRALKITLFYFAPIVVSLVAFVIGLQLLNTHYGSKGELVITINALPIILVVAGGFFFVLFLIKAVGDIAEEALTYYE